MALMTSFYTGVSGLKASQIGINTTSHNIVNVNTEGYVRQQTSFADGNYDSIGHSALGEWKVGLGVVVSETRHIRDLLLDKAYREHVGREHYYSSQQEVTEEVENILGELNNEAFQDMIKDLWESISEMAKAPDGSTSRAGLVMTADEFVTRVNSVSSQLNSYQQNLDTEVKDTVDRINSLADTIYDLNLTIQKIESAGVESANDYRDKRDLALDELASLIDITYVEDEHSFVSVRAESTEFITRGGVFHMGTKMLDIDDDSAYLTPVWPHLGEMEVYVFNTEISTNKGNDIGRLKGLMQARGDVIATYKDVPHEPDEEDPIYRLPDGTIDISKFRDDYEAYQKEVVDYNFGVNASIIMKTQALFDQLINSMITTINDTLCPNKDTVISAGSTFTISAGTNYCMLADDIKAQLNIDTDNDLDVYGNLVSDVTFTLQNDITVSALDKENCGVGFDGQLGEELFSRANTQSRYLKLTDQNGEEYYVFNPYNNFGTEGLYTIGNLEINQNVLEESSVLGFWDYEHAANYRIAQTILEKWDQKRINLDPNNLTEKDFNDYYTTMVDSIASDGYVFSAVTENQQTVVDGLSDARSAIMGVSSEEELTNLIKFQNAYNASSRYINAVAEMIDTLINRVGNW